MGNLFLGAWISAFVIVEIIAFRFAGLDIALNTALGIAIVSALVFGWLWWRHFDEEYGS